MVTGLPTLQDLMQRGMAYHLVPSTLRLLAVAHILFDFEAYQNNLRLSELGFLYHRLNLIQLSTRAKSEVKRHCFHNHTSSHFALIQILCQQRLDDPHKL